jgi:acylphosphatase
MYKAHFKITGNVQGVFYRVHARQKAEELGLKGTVENMPDGSVEATFQSPAEEALLKFKEWAHKGSPSSTPENVEMTLV